MPRLLLTITFFLPWNKAIGQRKDRGSQWNPELKKWPPISARKIRKVGLSILNALVSSVFHHCDYCLLIFANSMSVFKREGANMALYSPNRFARNILILLINI